jgi:hypothetical protein
VLGTIVFLLLGIAAGLIRPGPAGFKQDPAGNPAARLKKILIEIRELGPRPGEDFIKQEFFIGGPDDDDTNKDTSVVVLIQSVNGVERMTVQVTRMERNRNDPRIKTARETRSIVGGPDGKLFRIARSDFAADELESVCAQILRAVQDKKRLLKGSGLNIQQKPAID